MRGKDKVTPAEREKLRITPAHAGKSVDYHCNCIIWQDHPRPCGEKKDLGVLALKQLGSPPPMRGKDIEWNSAIQGNRITPAHAGKSLFFRNIGIFKQDHPRPRRVVQKKFYFLIEKVA